ncbi:MAG: 3-keto-5-aminohexanoate cleavage protein [Gammaproteobacteria bacterium]
MSRKVVLTCAVTGGGRPRQPAVPITPAQIADNCLEAAKEGAAVVHIHVRNPETGLSSDDPKLFDEVVDRVRSSGVDVVINLTCGMGALFVPDPEDESRPLPTSKIYPVPRRMRHIESGLPELASFDITAGNRHYGAFEAIYMNTPRSMRLMAKRFRELGVKPELEVFDAGNIVLAKELIAEGLIDGPPLFQMVLGVKWGAPSGIEPLLYQRNLLPPDAVWQAFGIGPEEMPMLAHTALLGGHVRVGLEDNLYLSRGVYATNGKLVERARTLLDCLGFSLATPEEAREIFHIKKRTPSSVTVPSLAR